MKIEIQMRIWNGFGPIVQWRPIVDMWQNLLRALFQNDYSRSVAICTLGMIFEIWATLQFLNQENFHQIK